MEHNRSTFELSIQIFQSIKSIKKSGNSIIHILSKVVKWGGNSYTSFVSELENKVNELRYDENFKEAALCNMIQLD